MFIKICIYFYWKYFRFKLWLAHKMVNSMSKSNENLRKDIDREMEDTDKMIERIKNYAIH